MNSNWNKIMFHLDWRLLNNTQTFIKYSKLNPHYTHHPSPPSFPRASLCNNWHFNSLLKPLSNISRKFLTKFVHMHSCDPKTCQNMWNHNSYNSCQNLCSHNDYDDGQNMNKCKSWKNCPNMLQWITTLHLDFAQFEK